MSGRIDKRSRKSKMLIEDIALFFNNIGVNKNMAGPYFYILKKGPLAYEEIKSFYKKEDISSIIQQLISIPLVSFDLDKNMRMIYYALKPKMAFRAILDQELWKKTPPIRSSSAVQDTELKRLISKSKQIGNELNHFYQRRNLVDINSMRIARNENQLAVFLCEAIATATAEIVSVSSSPLLPKIALIWNELLKKIKVGVEYKRIIDLWEMGYHGYEIKRRDVKEIGVDLRIVEKERIDKKYYVVDDKQVVSFNPDILNVNNFFLSGQIIKNKSLARKFKAHFYKLWEEAIPADYVLRYMAEIRSNLLQRAFVILDNIGLAWLKTLIDYGSFAEWPILDENRKDKIKKIAIKHKLVVPSSEFRMGVAPNYNWSYEMIRNERQV